MLIADHLGQTPRGVLEAAKHLIGLHRVIGGAEDVVLHEVDGLARDVTFLLGRDVERYERGAIVIGGAFGRADFGEFLVHLREQCIELTLVAGRVDSQGHGGAAVLDFNHADTDFTTSDVLQVAVSDAELIFDTRSFAFELCFHILNKGAHRFVLDELAELGLMPMLDQEIHVAD